MVSPPPVAKFVRWLSRKNIFFYFNLCAFLAGAALTVPIFYHYSTGNPVIFGYSRNYVLYLCLYTAPWIVLLWMVLTKGPIFQQRLFFFFILGFPILESSSRVFEKPQPFRHKEYKRVQPYIMFAGEPNATLTDRGARMGATRREERLIKLNQLGFRGDLPSKQKKEDEYRIFMLGGSTVFNGEPLSKSIAGQIEQLFHNSGHRRVRVYNWGVVSFVSGQELALLLHTVIDYRPDAVIVYNGANDIHSRFNYDPRPGYPYNFLVVESGLARIENVAPWSSLLASLFYKSHALRILYGASLERQIMPVGQVRKQIGNYRTPEWENAIVTNYVKNVKKMCSLAHAHHFRLALFLQPLLYDKSPHVGQEERLAAEHPDEFKVYLARLYKALRAELVSLNMSADTWPLGTCIAADLRNVFQDDSREFFWDIVHTNNAGNAVIARHIYASVHPFFRFSTNGKP